MALTSTVQLKDGGRGQVSAAVAHGGGQRIHLLTDRDSVALNVTALQQQLAERAAATRLLNRQLETLTAQAASAAEKIAERETALAWAHEELVHRDNEIHSLQNPSH